MPDLATLIGYPSGQAPATGAHHRCSASATTAGPEVARGVGTGGGGGWSGGAGGGGGGGGGAGDDAGDGAGSGASGDSLRRCSAVHTANAAPLIRPSKKS